MTHSLDAGAGSRPPGWYPDPSWPAVVRWWDGTAWTTHTAPNDARIASRGAPKRVVRVVVLTACIVLGVLGLAGVACVALFAYGMNQWASNK